MHNMWFRNWLVRLLWFLPLKRFTERGAVDERRIFELDEKLAAYVFHLAEQEQRPPEAVAGDLLASGLAQRDLQDETVRRWQSLSPREQQVTALVCQGYTNRQIAATLTLSPDTIKTHIRNALLKFDLHSKGELRMLLEGWDFNG
jgi:DNA-binding CsgD family transcriptional regulator